MKGHLLSCWQRVRATKAFLFGHRIDIPCWIDPQDQLPDCAPRKSTRSLQQACKIQGLVLQGLFSNQFGELPGEEKKKKKKRKRRKIRRTATRRQSLRLLHFVYFQALRVMPWANAALPAPPFSRWSCKVLRKWALGQQDTSTCAWL